MGFDWRKRAGKSEIDRMDAATYTAYRIIELVRNRPGRSVVAEMENIFMSCKLYNDEFEYPSNIYFKRKSAEHIYTMWRLPRGVTYSMYIEAAEKIGDGMQSMANVYKDNNCLVIELFQGVIPKKVNYGFTPDSNKSFLQVPLGIDITGTVTTWDLTSIPHVLIGGTTLTGKSNLLYTWIDSLMQLPSDRVALFIADMARTDFIYTQDKVHFAGTLDSISRMINFLIAEMDRRLDIVSKTKTFNIFNYNRKHPENPWKYLVFVCDEFAFCSPEFGTDKDDKAYRRALHASIAGLGMLARKVGIHLVLAMQLPTVDLCPTSIKSQFAGRVSFKTVNGTVSQVILDDPMAADLPGTKGRAWFLLGNEYKEIQTFYLDPEIAIERMDKFEPRREERYNDRPTKRLKA